MQRWRAVTHTLYLNCTLHDTLALIKAFTEALGTAGYWVSVATLRDFTGCKTKKEMLLKRWNWDNEREREKKKDFRKLYFRVITTSTTTEAAATKTPLEVKKAFSVQGLTRANHLWSEKIIKNVCGETFIKGKVGPWGTTLIFFFSFSQKMFTKWWLKSTRCRLCWGFDSKHQVNQVRAKRNKQ